MCILFFGVVLREAKRSRMAQRKKKFTKKKKHTASRELEADSDGDFELVTEVRNDDSVRKIPRNNSVGRTS